MRSHRRSGKARRFALSVLLLFSITTSLPADTIPDFEASYRIKRAGLTLGSTRLSFRSTPDGRYTYESTSGVGGFLSWLRKEHVRESSRGSMNAGNCAELLAKPDIDGGLIGGASLKAEDFLTICKAGD